MTDLQIRSDAIASSTTDRRPDVLEALINDPDLGGVFARIKLLSPGQVTDRLSALQKAAVSWQLLSPDHRINRVRAALKAVRLLDSPEKARILARATGRPEVMVAGELSAIAPALHRLVDAAEDLIAQQDHRFSNPEIASIACMPVKSDTLALDILTMTFAALLAGHAVMVCPEPLDAPAVKLIFDGLDTLPLTFLACGELQFQALLQQDFATLMMAQLPDHEVDRWQEHPRYEQLGGVRLPVRQNALVAADGIPMRTLASSMIASVFHNGGSFWTGPRAIFVVNAIYDDFIEVFREETRHVVLGLDDQEAFCGPLRSQEQRQILHQQITDAQAEGATLILGGGVPEDWENGFYYLPTILTGVEPGMSIFKQPVYGPVALIVRVRDVHDATMMMEQMHRTGNTQDEASIELALEIAGGADITIEEVPGWAILDLTSFHDSQSSEDARHAAACELLIKLRQSANSDEPAIDHDSPAEGTGSNNMLKLSGADRILDF